MKPYPSYLLQILSPLSHIPLTNSISIHNPQNAKFTNPKKEDFSKPFSPSLPHVTNPRVPLSPSLFVILQVQPPKKTFQKNQSIHSRFHPTPSPSPLHEQAQAAANKFIPLLWHQRKQQTNPQPSQDVPCSRPPCCCHAHLHHFHTTSATNREQLLHQQ